MKTCSTKGCTKRHNRATHTLFVKWLKSCGREFKPQVKNVKSEDTKPTDATADDNAAFK